MSDLLRQHVGRASGKLAEFLAVSFPHAEGLVAQNIAFLRAYAEAPPAHRRETDPLARLVERLALTDRDVEVTVLAGLPEEHEGFAAVYRSLHPRGEPRMPAGLAAQLLNGGRRAEFRAWLETSLVLGQGVVRVVGTGPFLERSIELADELWPVLQGIDVWPASLPSPEGGAPEAGLEAWLAEAPAARALKAVKDGVTCTVLVSADHEEVAFQRALALGRAGQRDVAGFRLVAPVDPERLRTLQVHALARGVVPVVRVPPAEGPGTLELPGFDAFPCPVMVAARTGGVVLRGHRPLIGVPAERLGPQSRRAVWRAALPTLPDWAPGLAARYPVEPAVAVEAARDLEAVARLEKRPASTDDLAQVMRTRAAVALGSGIRLIRPTAHWKHLVLSSGREAQLRAAIDRLELQSQVLDEWGFLKDRPGARGVRMLFAGPPGTGKTLSAEVMASALKVDLLLVDISRVVSKWIGETEKNLAAVFDTAERSQAVLFFDEADALFGRRTEVSDAHDRYANLETAYLLNRLERYEGLAILATNLRQNIDPAFLRRLEFVVEFDEPDREERHRLWSCHIPDPDLLAGDVNLMEVASWYPIVGGHIRNAAVAAAFLAAADGGRIGRAHVLQAIRREYEKSGKAFPGLPVLSNPVMKKGQSCPTSPP